MKVKLSVDGDKAAYSGRCLVAGLEVGEGEWVTREEVDRKGSGIVHRRWGERGEGKRSVNIRGLLR